MFDVIIIGGGAAGFFAALSAKKAHLDARVAIFEKSAALLSKVRVSGGGRCNVTHSCFDPIALSKNYPRGEKELVGPFHRFQPKDTIEWFESRGVKLKTEADGRMFPVTDSSETIIQCLISEAKQLGVEIFLRQKVETIKKIDDGFEIGEFTTKKLVLATGSSPQGHLWAQELGHTITDLAPSLFTFNVPNSPLAELSGTSFEKASVHLPGTSFSYTGPLLITHFGFSGPAVLKLSAFAARHLQQKEYAFEVKINWLPDLSLQEIKAKLHEQKKQFPNKPCENIFHFTKNFWKHMFPQKLLNNISLKELDQDAEKLHSDTYQVQGKTTHKEEFVTCGGVHLKEVNFKTMESKICPGLYFAGEILDIDGITGGFNFQNAWTTGYLAGIAP